MNKIRVGVICGGASAEHEVSLASARNIVAALDRKRFEVAVIGIDKAGAWHRADADDFLLHADDPRAIALKTEAAALLPGHARGELVAADSGRAALALDVVFPIVHGPSGEDGTLQGVLRTAGLAFVGSDTLGSAVAMDKDVAKRLLRDAGLNVAPFKVVTAATVDGVDFATLAAELGTPLFVKPANLGSSVGVSRVTSAAELNIALDLALAFDHKALIEAAIAGREIECAILGNDAPEASGCGEIVVAGDGFYGYDTKYVDDGAAEVVIPAQIPEADSERIRAVALSAFTTLGCAGLARVDVFLTRDGQIVVNEVNTLPGFTKISMYPKLWQAAGMSYTELVARLIELALERHVLQSRLKTSAGPDR